MIDLTEAWEEWHEKCAIDKCSDKNSSDLCRVANHEFKKALNKMPKSIRSIEAFSISSENRSQDTFKHVFRLMETELLPLAAEEERREFKNRIFEGRKPGEVSGYFFRCFFRSFVKDKKNRSFKIPDKPDDYDGSDEEWNESLLLKSNGIEENFAAGEHLDSEVAEKAAKSFFEALSKQNQLALWAYLNGYSMNNPILYEAADLGHSTFSARPETLIEGYMSALDARCPAWKGMEWEDKKEYMKLFLSALASITQKWETESDFIQSLVSNPDVKKRKKGI